ncbi:large ribosomal subunit protein bL34m [Microcaecilia unicolor]|uniref:Large ribosomal subunit protein bL34m n=1 Tax=Microcaecilia unicolor TaxID=1415580 RepID=A0A6P7Z5Z6_9AMPH|nr:39S ribosomal protein L34, mitochondrial [Microcaecilia unicolor]
MAVAWNLVRLSRAAVPGSYRFLLMQRLAPEPSFQQRMISIFSHTGHQLLPSCKGLGEKCILQVSPLQLLPWNQQQIRTKKRGTEYQPNNNKRLKTHGWKKRISSRGGIEIILRRMLKGRKSLTH